jgi:cysteine desulfurase / selenocysteine lyase
MQETNTRAGMDSQGAAAVAGVPDARALFEAGRARELFAGIAAETPLLDGRVQRFVNLDNAATTPPLRCVLDHLYRCAEWYGSVHRGTGFKSLLSTEALARCRARVGAFVGTDPAYHTVIFCANATDALNRLCNHFELQPDELFLSTIVEHHSNLLPWRFKGQVDYVAAKSPCGMVDLADLEAKLRAHSGKVRLVAVSGASNVTGLIPPLAQMARLAHAHGAQFLVDASQLVAHRAVSMGRGDDPERIDFLVFSGHKMYAPFGCGVLIGPRDFFAGGRPSLVGGGTVRLVTLNDVEWAEAPEKEEAGTPNLLGICALSQAMETLTEIGMARIADHEQSLTRYALARLEKIPGIHVVGGCQMVNLTQRLGVIPIQAEGYHHAQLAAILGYEWGIGVRNGCFCAHPYIKHLLGVSDAELNGYLEQFRAGRQALLPGLVRVSFGLYNTQAEIDYLAGALDSIVRHGPQATYCLDTATESYSPAGFRFDFAPFLRS